MVAVLAVFVVVLVVVVAVIVVVRRQELRVDVQLGIEVEAAQVEDLGDRHLAEVHLALRRARVHVLQPVNQRIDFAVVDQVGLADEDLVGKAHLAPRFLAVSSWLSACLASTSVRIESSR